ncbi:helix-turn-helix transcriptional regulator [Xanthobacter sp. V2C-4]|uniref:helix-turn-helix domain-containing protein n=1 Tax=Xanthobacter albus TaxID=3119929 RepID=UPI00372C0B21
MGRETLQIEQDDHRRELRLQAGAWLRAQREAVGLSQREFAERVGAIYYTFVSQIEAGRGRIPSERYEAWARALKLEPRLFATKMLGFYDPATYALIFGRETASAATG